MALACGVGGRASGGERSQLLIVFRIECDGTGQATTRRTSRLWELLNITLGSTVELIMD